MFAQSARQNVAMPNAPEVRFRAADLRGAAVSRKWLKWQKTARLKMRRPSGERADGFHPGDQPAAAFFGK